MNQTKTTQQTRLWRGRSLFMAWSVIAALAFVSGSAQAQLAGTDTAVGDDCSAFAAGTTRLTSVPGIDVTAATLICDGSVWQKVSKKIQYDSAACTGALEAAIRYNSGTSSIEICDGTAWRPVTSITGDGSPSNFSDEAGYFVITDGTWDGDLATASGATGGIEGANQLCFTDLTNNDWMGKTDATTRGIFTEDNVRAFLCDKDDCNGALPATTYYFAVSGDNTLGGAHFITNSNGYGPGNNQNWSGTNYFGGVKEFWSNRKNEDTQLWNNNPLDDFKRNRCEYSPGWTSINTDNAGSIGITNNTEDERWDDGTGYCHVPRHLVCFVHPY